MEGARVTRIRLNYGNQRDATHDIPQADRPVVISGPNGSGKTTLLEAMVRTLFGFNKRESAEKDLLEARLETLESGWCEVDVRDPEGVGLRIRRSFDDARVVITAIDTQEERFKGDANPGGSNQDTRRFRGELRKLLGMADYEDFSKTAFVEQGRLIGSKLDQDLLRVASGGTGGVDEARSALEKRYFELTKAALPGDPRGKNKDRLLEELLARRIELQEALSETAEQERRRGPVAESLRSAESRIAALRTEIGLLETAQGAVQSERGREAEKKLARKRTGDAKRARERLQEARAAEQTARERFAVHEVQCAAAEVEVKGRELRTAVGELRKAEEALESARRAKTVSDGDGPVPDVSIPGAVWGGAAAAAIAAVLAVALDQPVLWGVAGVAALFLGWQWRAHRARWAARALKRAEREKRDAEETARLRGLESAVESARNALTEPAAVLGLGDTDPDRLESAVEPITKDATALLLAEGKRKERASDADDVLRELTDAMAGDDAVTPDPEDPLGSLEVFEEHYRKAEVRLAMEGEGQFVELPEAVDATPEGVKRALKEARDELGAAERTRDQLREELLTEATPERSSVALRDELQQLSEEIAQVEARVRSLRVARELLLEAYEEFREGDEQRLLGRISDRATALSRGQIGPVQTDGELEEARVQVMGRVTPIDSPGLSYGERVAISLALRLGATDFLARNGIRPPLLIDEPFDDLDPERARGVWALLQQIAEERQVIVTSQNPLTLTHLDITPDIRLTGRGLSG